MIVPVQQSGRPLEGNLIQRKDPTGYGPGVPEYQETIQIRRSGQGLTMDVISTYIDVSGVYPSTRHKKVYVNGSLTGYFIATDSGPYVDVSTASENEQFIRNTA